MKRLVVSEAQIVQEEMVELLGGQVTEAWAQFSGMTGAPGGL